MELYARIKKYLILLTSLFVVISGAHMALLYIYDGAQVVAEKGGTLTIGVVGSAPSLNPSQYLIDAGNDFVLRLLYRSLLTYNPENNSVTGDLANCDVSNYAEIRCVFKAGSIWNTGEAITPEDVLATYSALAETDINKTVQKLLSKTAIATEGNTITFRTSSPSSEILPLLMTPIMKKDVAEKIRNSSLKNDDARYSGPYRFEKRESDAVRSTDKITLVRNENIVDAFGYSRIVIRYFPDREGLLAQANSVNIIYPNRTIENSPSSIFEKKQFLTPNFVGLFANTAHFSQGVRKLLLASSQEVVGKQLVNGQIAVKNPFFTEEDGTIFESGATLSGELAKLGYYKKDVLIEMDKSDTLTKRAQALAQASAPKRAVYFTEPSNLLETVITPREEVLLKGRVPAGTESVSIGGYKLRGYTPGDTSFQYRARTELGNLRMGTNTYPVVFYSKTNSVLGWETLTLHMLATEAERAAKIALLTPKPPTESTGSYTPPEALTKLDDAGYYKKDGSRFSLIIRSLDVIPEIAETAKVIARNLENKGVNVKIESVEVDPDALSEAKKGENKNYDLFITGVNLGYFWTYLFPHFHSGQSENGLNFAKLRNIELDSILETLRSEGVSSEKLTKLQSDIVRILRTEGAMASLYAIPNAYFADKNVKWLLPARILPSSSSIGTLLPPSYINENRIIDFQKKSVADFFIWCMHHFREALGLQ